MDRGEISYRNYLSGDDQGLSELIETYKESLTLYLNSLTGDILLAEEMMEETFVKLAVKKPRFAGKSSFKTWLYAIGRHTAVDGLRRRSRQEALPLESLPDEADEEASLEEKILREERRIALHQSMKQLPTDYRQILYLSYFEELSNPELQQVLGLSKRQVENRLSRARASLKKLLSQEDLFS